MSLRILPPRLLAAILAAAALPMAARAADDSGPDRQPAGEVLAVVGGVLIDGTGAAPIEDSAIIIEDGRIMAAGPRRETRIPPGAVAVDATGLTVLPGLIDMHTHLVDVVDLGDFLRYGVTSVRHLGNTSLKYITDLKATVESGRRRGPRIFHCGRFVVSQPPLLATDFPPDQQDQYSIIHDATEIPAVVKELVDAGADVVKVKAHIDPAILSELARVAGEAGLPVYVDIFGARNLNAMEILDTGITGLEHLSGIEFDSPERTELALRKMLANGVYAVPTFSVLERTVSGERVEVRKKFVRSFHRRGGRVLAGSDTPTGGTPPGFSLHEELGYLVSAGLPPLDAIRSATGLAGQALGYQGQVGTIETGAWADLLIVRGSPAENISDTLGIVRVFKGGVQVWPAAAGVR